MVVLDIGAHIGYYTLQAAARVGTKGQVHSFEPVRTSFMRLTENISLNNLKNVCVNQYIVHDHCGNMDIFVADKTNTGSSSLAQCMENFSGRTENVECTTVDKYVEQRGLREIHLVKIDVEGSELSVLRGMSSLLESQKDLQLLVEINETALALQGVTPKELFEYLAGFMFHPLKITKDGLVELQDPTTDESLMLFRRKSM